MKINDDFNKKRTIINLYISKNKKKFEQALSDTPPTYAKKFNNSNKNKYTKNLIIFMDDFYPLSLFFDPYPFILLFLFYSFFLSIKICLYKKITFTIYPAFLISFLACLLSTSSFVNLKPFSTILRLSPNYLALSTILLSSISPAFYI